MPSPLLAVEQACASLPRAVQPFVVLYRWVCRFSHRQALDETRLSPAAAGLFRVRVGGPHGTSAPLPGGTFSVAVRCATNRAAGRWGGGLAFWRNRQARYGKYDGTHDLAPLPC